MGAPAETPTLADRYSATVFRPPITTANRRSATPRRRCCRQRRSCSAAVSQRSIDLAVRRRWDGGKYEFVRAGVLDAAVGEMHGQLSVEPAPDHHTRRSAPKARAEETAEICCRTRSPTSSGSPASAPCPLLVIGSSPSPAPTARRHRRPRRRLHLARPDPQPGAEGGYSSSQCSMSAVKRHSHGPVLTVVHRFS